MVLVIQVALAVIVFTAVVAAACYLNDQIAERHETDNS